MSNVNDILKLPYARVLIPEQDGRFSAEILEFSGCVAYGDNANDALEHLNSVASDWIASVLEQGQTIPSPMAASDYSGRLVLRMAKGLHQRAAMCAEREGVSLNQFIATCLAEAVGERSRSHSMPFAQQYVSFTQERVITNFPISSGAIAPSGATGVPIHTMIAALTSAGWVKDITIKSEHAYARG